MSDDDIRRTVDIVTAILSLKVFLVYLCSHIITVCDPDWSDYYQTVATEE